MHKEEWDALTAQMNEQLLKNRRLNRWLFWVSLGMAAVSVLNLVRGRGY